MPFAASMAGAPLAGKSFGTVFAVTPSGKERILYRFKGSGDGAHPESRLIAVNGTFYGTTTAGGANNQGTVFAVTPQGSETVLHSFGATNDGADPQAGLISVNGTLYGTTRGGGTAGYGTVFSITTSGSETVLHSFEGAPNDGQFSAAPLLEVNGTLYGTTMGGGASNCGGGPYHGCGTLFKMTPSGKESLVTSFAAGKLDLVLPVDGLRAVGKELYGTAEGGGGYQWGGGVFKCSTSGNPSVIHSFSGNKGKAVDGWTPESALTDVDGTLYGTTYKGGADKSGVVFAIAPAGAEGVVYSFPGRGGPELPAAGLTDVNGKLYGTTYKGGTYGGGTVFGVTRSGTETVIHNFGAPGAGDGRAPHGDLINVNGTLYGTTTGGGS